jgi:hypothetical protein
MRIAVNVLITLLSFGIMGIFEFVVSFYFIMNLGDWSYYFFQKFLTFNLQRIDHILIQISPLLYIMPILKTKSLFWKEMLVMTVSGVCSIFLFIIIGITIALLTWGNENDSSSFLPNYILEPPFQNYSTIFVLIGISFPILILFFKNKGIKISNPNDTI